MERTWRGVVYIATSVDGFIARADSDITWLTEPDASVQHPGGVPGEGHEANCASLMKRVDQLVMGRHTYEKLLTFNEWPYPIPVIVLSTTLPQEGNERVTVVRSLAEAVDEVNSRGAKGVYVDGGFTIQSFMKADLIDELTITTAPVIIGGGIPLFGSLPADVTLSLQAVEASGGYLSARYDVVR
jgi:dihydrofolate reductase